MNMLHMFFDLQTELLVMAGNKTTYSQSLARQRELDRLWFSFFFPLIITAAVVFFIVLAYYLVKYYDGTDYKDVQIKAAGDAGEQYVTRQIKSVLHEDDVLLTNVSIAYNGQKTELDDVIINSRGIYFVEVKNYRGRLYGSVDDDTWYKSKVTDGGTYNKTVRNPIKQMKRQTFILSKLLGEHGINVWVKGYVYFVDGNSPVSDKCILDSPGDVDDAIHDLAPRVLTEAQVQRVVRILQGAV